MRGVVTGAWRCGWSLTCVRTARGRERDGGRGGRHRGPRDRASHGDGAATSELEHRYSRLERTETETGPLRLYMYLCARATVRWLTTYSKNWRDEHPWPVRALPGSHDEAGYHTAGPMIYSGFSDP